jgi:high-affinity iron transporter
VLFGVILVRGSMRVNLQKFFRVTTVILFIVAAQLVFAGIHELEEAGVFPGSPELTAIIAPIVRYETVLFLTAVALSSFLLLNKRRKAAVVVTAPIPEERRAARAAQAGD